MTSALWLVVGMAVAAAGCLEEEPHKNGQRWASKRNVGPELEDPARRSLVIGLDGLRPDALKAADTPNLDGLVNGNALPGYRGFYELGTALDDAPTLSAPNHWAIMTGSNASQHGVLFNDEMDIGDSVSFPHYLTLVEREASGSGTASLTTWSGDLDLPCRADLVRDGTDAGNAKTAAQLLRGRNGADVHALLLFLDDIDAAGHDTGYGPESEVYMEAIEETDRLVGMVLDDLSERATYDDESWQIIVVSDHGGIGNDHGGDSELERTIPFIVAGRRVFERSDDERRAPSVVDVVPTVLEHLGVPVPAALTGMSWTPTTAPTQNDTGALE